MRSLSLAPLVLAAACGAHPEVSFNEPPGAPELAIEPAAPTTLDVLQGITLAEAPDAEGDLLSYRYAWLRDGEAWATTGPFVEAEATRKGETWRFEMAASDGQWEGPAGAAEVTILNSPPVVTAVSVLPEVPLTADDLVATATGTDADDDNVAFVVSWSVDGVARPDLADSWTVPAAETTSGELWTVSVKADDAEELGAALTASVRIDNSPPIVEFASLYPTDPVAGENLACTAYDVIDDDGDAVSLSFDWYRDGTLVGSDSPYGTTSYYTRGINKGELWQVVVTANDGFEDGPPTSTDFVEVQNTAPSVSEVVLGPDPAYEGSTLECNVTAASDPDDDDIDYDYVWTIDGSAVGGSGRTLDGSSFDRGDEVACSVTPFDGTDEGAAASSNAVSIANTLPSLTGVDLSPDPVTALTGATASCTGWHDDDGDPNSVRYTWYVNGVAAGTSSTLAGSWLVRGDAVYAECVPYDNYGDGAAVTSAAVTVENSAPSVSSAWLSPSGFGGGTDATVNAGSTSDADGDTISLEYAWYVEGILLGETGDTLGAENYDRGDQVYATVTPWDGYEYGSAATTPTATVPNSAPSAVASVDVSSGLEQCDTITLDAGASSDEDGDAVTYDWSIISKPSGSRRASSDIDSTDDANPTFVVDAEGTFVFQVVVSDGSTSDRETVSVEVSARTANIDPTAAAGDDQSASAAAACVSNGYMMQCPECDDASFDLSAAESTDDDGDPLTYVWSYTASSSVSVDDTTLATPTVTIGNVVPSFGSTSTVEAEFTLTVYDCAGGRATDTVTLSYTCTGE